MLNKDCGFNFSIILIRDIEQLCFCDIICIVEKGDFNVWVCW